MDVSNDKYSKLCQSENNTDPNVSPILTSRHVFKINHKFSKVNIAEANIRVKPIENCDGESLINSATVENKLDRSPVLKSNYYTKKKISYEEPKIGKTKDVQNQNFKSLERITSDDVCISSYDSQVSPLNVISQESRISSLQISPEENHVSLKSDLCDNSEINNMSSKEITFNNCTKTNTVESVSKKKKKFPLTSNAGRLQKLLRKQDSMISIWKHEKYMASRGNFECPVAPEKSLILKIIGCREECGMFLIDCEDCVENTKYIAIINSYFVKEVTVSCNWTLTIYKPYKIIQINSNENTANVDKVIVNVCKFDVTKV